MSYHAVKWRETFDMESSATACDAERDVPRDRYDLATALRTVRRLDTSAVQAAVFDEIKAKNWVYRTVDSLYSQGGSTIVQPLILLAYMLKCIVSIGSSETVDDAQAVMIANYPNERHAVARVAALVPGVRFLRLSFEHKHVFARGQLRASWHMLRAIRRLWPFLARLARCHSFMPAARIASALAFYIRFVQLLGDRPGLAAVVVASNYSPEAVGLAAAAHRLNRRVAYVNHAPVPANGAPVSPVLADCAIFYGDAVRQTYERRSRCTAEVALIGQPWTSRPMEWRDEVRTVGIFLTALTRADVVTEVVSAIRASLPDVRILIRNHPVALLQTDFSKLEAQDANLQITIGTPLDDEITACDVIICGNSGVAMNVLSGGRPVAYIAALDGLNFDYNGFVESGLVCHVEEWSDDIYARLKKFYFNPKWQSVMWTYDASYGADVAELERAAAETIKRYLTPADVSTRAASTSDGRVCRLPERDTEASDMHLQTPRRRRQAG